MEENSGIRNYLASFHEEFGGGDGNESESVVGQESDEDGTTEEIYRYVSSNELNGDITIKEEVESDSEIIQDLNPDDCSYIQDMQITNKPSPRKKGAEIIRLGSVDESKKTEKIIKDEEVDPQEENPTAVSAVEQDLHFDEKQALEMVAQFAEQAVAQGGEIGEPYQTVTIVPSDTNPGELSYVLFVSESPDGLGKDMIDGSLPIFQLDDASELTETFLNKDGVKMRAIRLAPRKTPLTVEQFMCQYCNYASSKRYLLSRHMKSHSEERPHKCGVCERGFKTVASLQNHVNTHTGTRPHPCKDCASCFTTSGELVRHIRYKHTHEKPHKCTECDYASVELSKLKRHMRCHTGERPYQCPHCTYASPDTYKLKRHLRIHTGEKPYECDVCQARFTQSNSLKAHKLIHSGNKPVFHCEYCPATCGRKTDLRIHMEKLHSSDKPHKCRRCDKVFLDRYSYKIHIKTHDGEKCFKCDLCNYASISQRHLETHMYVHTDQKPFVCKECNQSFRQKQLLKRHINLYHNPQYIRPPPKEKNNVCAVCSKAFRHKGNLIRHYTIHHDPEASVSDKETAMRLEESKESGIEDEIEDTLGFSSKDNQQVVVFEVIQLPGANQINTELDSMVNDENLLLNGNKTIKRAENILSLSESETNKEFENDESYLLKSKRKQTSNSNKIDSRNSKKLKVLNNKNIDVFKITDDKVGLELNTVIPDLPALEEHSKSVTDSENDALGEKEFENCFRFEEENDEILAVSVNSTFETFDSGIIS